MEKRYYLAYGSNLNLQQMKARCSESRVLGKAKIVDYCLLFKGSRSGAYLTIEPKNGFNVPVAVWEVTAADEAKLDIYEGYPAFYYKKEMQITYKEARSGKLKKVPAFVYIMHEDQLHGIPTYRYMEICRQGYADFGFDAEFLAEAYDYSKEMKESYENKKAKDLSKV